MHIICKKSLNHFYVIYCFYVCIMRRKWQPTLVFLPENSRGQRSLVCYNQWGCKEWNTTEHACMHRIQETFLGPRMTI